MADHALIDLDYVLRRQGGAPIREGLMLYRGLLEQTNVVLVISEYGSDDARRWLEAQHLTLPPYILQRDDVLDHARNRLKLRVSLRVTADPEEAAAALREGVPSMLFSHPLVSRREFLPGYRREQRPWSAIQDELDYQRTQIAASVALDEEAVAP